MPSSSPQTNSFIPKRGSSKHKRRRPGRKIFVVTIIAYSFVFAALLAAGASVLYKNVTETLLEKEVVALNSEIDTFSVQDLERVKAFDLKLQKTTERVLNTASVVAVLDELEDITAHPIQILSLSVVRNQDDSFLFDLELVTETLDAALFQRKLLLAKSEIYQDVVFSEINLASSRSETDETEIQLSDSQIALRANFSVPLEVLLYEPSAARQPEVGTNVLGARFTADRQEQVEVVDSVITSSTSNDTSL